jgi:diguanylate cyclase (GGDEF)-like protein
MEDEPDPGGYKLEDAQVRALNRRARLALTAIIACIVLLATAVWIIPFVLDRRDLDHAREHVQQALQAQGERIGQASLEHSYWNQAVEKVIHEQDTAWADSELGGYLHNAYGIAGIVAEDADGNRRYVYSPDDAAASSLWTQASPPLERLGADVLASDTSSPRHAHTYRMVEGTLFVIAASPFIAYQPTRLDTTEPHGVLFLARAIDRATLTEWSERYNLPRLGVTGHEPGAATEREATVSVMDMAGNPVARLEWEPERAGWGLLAQAMPWGVSLGIVFVVAASALSMNLRRMVSLARSNITELDQQKQKLFRQAMFDDVSNLHNRTYLISRLEEELSRIRRNGTSSIFIFLDLDGFKIVNDTMGHSAGDELLRQVGGRLLNGVRAEDIVCRFGGDEFCLLITGIDNGEEKYLREIAEKIARQVIAELEHPFTVDDKPVSIGASAGIVVIPDDTANIEDILRFGDLAMYRAKLETGNSFIHYQRDFLHDINYRNAIRHKLDSAVPKKEFGLHYQAIHEIGSGRIVGFEALARWDSEELGLIRPSQFIAIAEESDTIIRLGRWIIDEALRDACSLREVAGGACFVAINVSAKQLADPGFRAYLEERMDIHGVDPGDVHLELTESDHFGHGTNHVEMLRAIRGLGVHLSLDDFGTGYASLTWLQQYPLSTVKIDHDFVVNVMSDSRLEGIIRAVVQMADSLGIRIIAEGVETSAQEQALIGLGCHWAQGFHYSKPKPLTSLTARGPVPSDNA